MFLCLTTFLSLHLCDWGRRRHFSESLKTSMADQLSPALSLSGSLSLCLCSEIPDHKPRKVRDLWTGSLCVSISNQRGRKCNQTIYEACVFHLRGQVRWVTCQPLISGCETSLLPQAGELKLRLYSYCDWWRKGGPRNSTAWGGEKCSSECHTNVSVSENCVSQKTTYYFNQVLTFKTKPFLKI